jgi:hypothetical protein
MLKEVSCTSELGYGTPGVVAGVRLRRVEVRFTAADAAMLAEMQRRTGMSRSKLARLAIRSHYGDAALKLRAHQELAVAMVETARREPS